MHKSSWNFHNKLVPIILGCALVLTGLLSVHCIKNLQGNARVINYTGIVRGATQRLVKQELSHVMNTELTSKLDEIMAELMSGEGENNLIKLESTEYQTLIMQMQHVWEDIKNEIIHYRNGTGPERLFWLSEEYFDLADKAVFAAEKYSEKKVQNAKSLLIGMNGVFVLVAILSIISSTLQRKRQEKLDAAENENRKKSEQIIKMFQDIRAPMNEISELMYVSDVESYELLFINDAGRKTFHVEDKRGQKCYKVLQGLDEPCSFCKTPFLKQDENYSWEFTNPLVNRHYLLKDRLINWEGRKARLEIAFDMTEAENKKNELRNMLDSEKVIVECIRELYENHDIRTATNRVLELIGAFLLADRTYIFEIHGNTVNNTYEWCKKGIETQQPNLQEIPLTIFTPWFDVLRESEYLVVEDIENLAIQKPEIYQVLHGQRIERLVLVTLEQNNEINSCIGVDNPPVDRMQNAISILQTVRYFLMIASHRFRDEAQLAQLSYYDTLTNFYNRNRYIQDVEIFSEQHQPVGVVFVDVNGLKEVNDEYGHDRGDRVLKECAMHIDTVFKNDHRYRIGGDEFVIFCIGHQKEEFLERVNVLRLYFTTNMQSLCRAAIGAQWSQDGKSLTEAIKMADEKMYEDKRSYYRQPQTVKHYRHQDSCMIHLKKKEVLQEKIQQNKFIILLQPKFLLADQSVFGAEALVRYQLQDQVLVKPDEFVSLLEDAETIDVLDLYVIETVCAQIRYWLDKNIKILPLSINISPVSLSHPQFVKQVISIYEQYKVEKAYLEIEIMGNSTGVDTAGMQSLSELHRAGFRIAIDNFGIQSSSISLFTSAEFETIKIDESLISDITHNKKLQSFLEALTKVCDQTHTKIIADGVEEKLQADLLHYFGIEMAQGFLFSPPIQISEFEVEYLTDI